MVYGIFHMLLTILAIDDIYLKVYYVCISKPNTIQNLPLTALGSHRSSQKH